MKYVIIYNKPTHLIPDVQFIFSRGINYGDLFYSDWELFDNRVFSKYQIFSQKEVRKHEPFHEYKKYGIIFKAKTSKGLRKKINEYFLLKEII